MDREIQNLPLIPQRYSHLDLSFIDMQRLQNIIRIILDKYFLYIIILNRMSLHCDYDLINYICGLLLSSSKSNPDGVYKEIREFYGSKSKPFVLTLWKHLMKIYLRIEREKLIERGLIQIKPIEKDKPKEKKEDAFLELVRKRENQNVELEMPKNLTEEEKIKWNETLQKKDYKRRRQSYRAKLTHLTKRTPIQIQRDLINTTYLLLCDEYDFKLNGEIERVTTLSTPQDLEAEARAKAIVNNEERYEYPLDARDQINKAIKRKRV